MPATTGGKRRKCERARISLDVEWGVTPACIYQGRITSLSSDGCFVRARERVAVRGVVFIRLMLAPGAASMLEGVVMARVRHVSEGAGFGAEFMTLKVCDEKNIRDIVEFYRAGGMS